jgi:IS30 family transposase
MHSKLLPVLDRNTIASLRNKQLWPIRWIASSLGRSPSTVSRELRRNAPAGYDHVQAHALARARLRGCRTRISERILDRAVELMCEGLSPEQAAEALRKEGVAISRQSIYSRIWEDHAGGGPLWKVLRHCGKSLRCRRYKTGPRNKQKRRDDGRRSIHSRPARIAHRRDYGHWEMDLLEGRGRKRPVLVLHERKSRHICAAFLASKDSGLVLAAARRLLAGRRVLTITTDNGPEFAAHRAIERELGCRVYFAEPYKSWQKGAVENSNGLLRQYLPKGTSFVRLPAGVLADACAAINWRIRKCLRWNSPDDLFPKILA